MNGQMTLATCIVAAGLLTVPAAAMYVEHWDDETSHNWKYWTTAGSPPENQGVAMMMVGSGGHLGGYARTPLHDLVSAHSDAHLWPAYTVAADRDASQALNLNTDPIVRISTKKLPDTDLRGASLAFFIGYWNTEADWAFWRHNTPIPVAERWMRTTIDVPAGDWLVIASGPGSTADPADIYDDPEQYGFTLFNWKTQPVGLLGFDEFANVPEPATVCFLGIGAIVMARRRSKE